MVEWVPFSEAAQQLGMSESTLRRRIKDGTIRAEKREGPYGLQWFIDPKAIQTAQEIVDVVRIDRTHDMAALAQVLGDYLAQQNAEIVLRLDTLSTMVEALVTRVETAEAAATRSQALKEELEAVKGELLATKQAAAAQDETFKGEFEVLRAKHDLAEERARKRDEDVVAQIRSVLQKTEQRRWRWPWQR